MPMDDPRLAAWLTAALGDAGPFTLKRLSGGNSNETLALRSTTALRILRRPPATAIDRGAHEMAREHRVLTALAGTDVPAPRALALDADENRLVMEAIDGVSLTDAMPAGNDPSAEALAELGFAVVDALAQLHTAAWQDIGLAGFGRPDGFLARQVGRWRAQRERHRVRELPWFDELADWLEQERPAEASPALIHGDFHLDNCLVTRERPFRVAAIVDWEMATIGDPLLDLGLFLAFWGDDRLDPPAMPRVQGVSRLAKAPARTEIARRYEELTGRSTARLDWYMALALWKLAAIVEGAYAHHLQGRLTSDYARELETDVPALVREAAAIAGLATWRSPQPLAAARHAVPSPRS
jgi:aminoglycoside phosphotransferase (APT) family kinase protein